MYVTIAEKFCLIDVSVFNTIVIFEKSIYLEAYVTMERLT
jgi:hypothetical protein